jgi:hypothetical protein
VARADDPNLANVPEATLIADINTLTAQWNDLYPWQWAEMERISRMIEDRETEINRRRLLAAKARSYRFPAYYPNSTYKLGVNYNFTPPLNGNLTPPANCQPALPPQPKRIPDQARPAARR